MLKKIAFLIILLVIVRFSGVTASPKREFRAVWIATVGNIDWPSKQGLSADVQQEEFRAILRRVKQNRLNAVIVQIRPAADALYESPYENWSRYLSGKQGQAPSPYYDPLTFMIEECHRQCIEFHAWLNPYRALVDANKNVHTLSHITYQQPSWFLRYGGKLYFDPGLKEVREYFIKIVLDIVKRYDVDAIHFDDYFYPYRIAGQEFPDHKSFAISGKTYMARDDWRRENVNVLIEALASKIKELKPWVKFGISPFGVWRNARKDPDGSQTTAGQTNYDDLFADVLLWLKKGWIDYILPQLYWERGHKAADYLELIQWWSRHAYEKHLYIGHGIYQVGTSSKACWRDMQEVIQQVDLTRSTKNIQGSSFYSAVAFKKDLCGLNDAMQYEIYPHIALLPVMPWIKSVKPQAPVVKMKKSGTGITLSWTSTETKGGLQYAIYRFTKGQDIDFERAENLLEITRSSTWISNEASGKYTYAVTALNRLHVESEPGYAME
ncbi:MAG: family 10 glycosylhydrolase [Chitinophagaceae bacterium]|nr:family 10 glycosylhydrolase [Chitinophagaceae bacterium]